MSRDSVRPKFLSMSKEAKLSLLGDMYRMMYSKTSKQIDLDTVKCGSAACLAGWCAIDPTVRQQLGIRMVSGWSEIVEYPSQTVGYGTSVGTALFEERVVNAYLFASHRPSDPKDHRIAALIRLLYLGDLVNRDVDREYIHVCDRVSDVRCATARLRIGARNSSWIRRYLGLRP